MTRLLRLRLDGSVVFFKNQKATRLSRVSLMLSRDALDAIGPFRSARFGADEELHAKIVARLGRSAICRIAAPLMLSLWSESSATRQEGSESLENGYRAVSRRSYSELVFTKYIAGTTVEDAVIDQCLRDTGNYRKPQDVIEITQRS